MRLKFLWLLTCLLPMGCVKAEPTEQYQLGYLKALEAPMIPGVLGGPTDYMWASVLVQGLVQNRVRMWNDINGDGRNDTSEMIDTAIKHYGARNIATGFYYCNRESVPPEVMIFNQKGFAYELVRTAQNMFPECEGLDILQCNLKLRQSSGEYSFGMFDNLTMSSNLKIEDLPSSVCPKASR